MNQDILAQLSGQTWIESPVDQNDNPHRVTLYDYILQRYVPNRSIIDLATTSSVHRDQATRTLWRVVHIKIDGIWGPTTEDDDAPVAYGNLVQWCLAARDRRGLVPGPRQCRDIRITDDLEGLQAGRIATPERVRESLWGLRRCLSFSPAIRNFRWESRLRISMPLFDWLAGNRYLVRFEWTVYYDAVSFLYPRPGYQPELYGNEPSGGGLFRAGWSPQASVIAPMGNEDLHPQKIDCPETIVTLEGAYESSVLSLLHVLERRFTRIRQLNFFGPSPEDSVLPQEFTEAPTDGFFGEIINRGRNLIVTSLNLTRLGAEAAYIAEALDPAVLQDLVINWCSEIELLLPALAHKVHNLVAFHFFSPIPLVEDDEAPANEGEENEEQGNVGEEVEMQDVEGNADNEEESSDDEGEDEGEDDELSDFGPQHPLDLQAACDFVRGGVAGLKCLTMIGHFSGGRLHEFLFTAIQAHLSSLEQLLMLDGGSTELTRRCLWEIGVCSPHLVDLRIRATLPNPSVGNSGLLSHLPALLPEFRALQALMVLRTERTNYGSIILERNITLVNALEAAKVIPLRIAAYWSSRPLDRLDRPAREWIWAIRRPSDPGEPDLSVHSTPIHELLTAEMANIIYDALQHMTRNAKSLGVPRREFLGDRWLKI